MLIGNPSPRRSKARGSQSEGATQTGSNHRDRAFLGIEFGRFLSDAARKNSASTVGEDPESQQGRCAVTGFQGMIRSNRRRPTAGWSVPGSPPLAVGDGGARWAFCSENEARATVRL
jgi:hypothetical protein